MLETVFHINVEEKMTDRFMQKFLKILYSSWAQIHLTFNKIKLKPTKLYRK